MIRTFVGAVLGLTLAVAPAAAKNQAFKTANDAIKAAPKEVTGKVKSVNEEKGTVVLTVDGKDMTFEVNKDTKFVGPLGGVSEKGLKDDRMAKGNEVTVIVDGKTLKEVKLPRRTGDKEEDKKPADKKPEEKKPEK